MITNVSGFIRHVKKKIKSAYTPAWRVTPLPGLRKKPKKGSEKSSSQPENC